MDNKPVTEADLTQLYVPPPESHKGQNGRLLIIGGSQLFHAASLWSLTIASRIVDLVHYCSVPENNDIVRKFKEEFRNGIVVARRDVEYYIQEDDCILIGPGMVRSISNIKYQISPLRPSGSAGQANRQRTHETLEDILRIEDEGVQTGVLTNYLLAKYPDKQWVIDAGALQMVDVDLIPDHAILTPHSMEFEGLYRKYQKSKIKNTDQKSNIDEQVKEFTDTYGCITLLKGQTDIACSPDECRVIVGGNAGMTKGGTGDVLAGLIAALACKNDPYMATLAGSFINKKAGEDLYGKVGLYFNSTDLATQIPITMKRVLGMK